jgi:hypothetical protein
MNGAAQWRLLSDLHLGVPEEDPRRPGRVLPRFLRDGIRDESGARLHVVFVGDTFELAGLTEEESLVRLESILNGHQETFHALKTCAARGVQLHFLCGNHDVELARPSVAARLSALLSPAEPARVRVHPWLLHVPRVLVAEHGHQHHALHRIPEVLRTAVNGTDELELPPLAAWHAYPSTSRFGRVEVLARACLASELAERRIRVLAASGRNITGDGPPAAAARFARTLEAYGSGVPWYFSAHTHRAVESQLEGSATRYVNTGTWSSDVRGPGPDQTDRGLFPYGFVDVAADGTTSGGLKYWRPDGG